jgi:hypothetical protein
MNEPYLLRSIRKGKKRKQTKREEQEKEGRKRENQRGTLT